MKKDKDNLAKHQFWIVLGVGALVLLIWWVTLSFSVGADVKKKRDEYTAAKNKYKPPADPKNKSFLTEWETQEKSVQGLKSKVWDSAWQPQRDLMTWPAFDAGGQARYENAHFGDRLADGDRTEYKDKAYLEQFRSLDRFLAPRETDPLFFPVEFKGGFASIIRPQVWKQTPSNEECWLAQEDLWVKRELIAIVKDALDSIASCREITTDADKKEGARRFRNLNWELKLLLAKGAGGKTLISPKSTVKNVAASKRELPLAQHGNPLWFKLSQQGTEAVGLSIEGDPLAFDKEADVKKPVEVGFDWTRPLKVEQVFDWYTSPIKRIDAVELGQAAQSHRTVKYGLLLGRISPKPEEEKKEDASGSGPLGTGSPMGGPPPGMKVPGSVPGTSGPGEGGYPGGRQVSGNVTPNGLARERYLQVTDQVRRLPVALAVVVDQSYKEDVLAAVARSRLVIQTTQMHWKHIPPIQPTTTSEEEPPASDTPSPGPPRPGQGTRPPVGPGLGSYKPPYGKPPVTGPGKPGFPMGTGGNPYETTTVVDEGDRNLVEIAIYGIASLYERYPPKPPADPSATKDQPAPKK
jgi:hypothetical protein